TGTWLLGIVGILWFFDSGIALVLSFPSVKAWRKSFAFRFRRGGYALTFDLHRSGGVWIWGLLLMVAVTSISMNLGDP
ncbi:PepSY-associated TM helix domain-containing protein, partial [Caballeronia sp. INML3]